MFFFFPSRLFFAIYLETKNSAVYIAENPIQSFSTHHEQEPKSKQNFQLTLVSLTALGLLRKQLSEQSSTIYGCYFMTL